MREERSTYPKVLHGMNWSRWRGVHLLLLTLRTRLTDSDAVLMGVIGVLHLPKIICGKARYGRFQWLIQPFFSGTSWMLGRGVAWKTCSKLSVITNCSALFPSAMWATRRLKKTVGRRIFWLPRWDFFPAIRSHHNGLNGFVLLQSTVIHRFLMPTIIPLSIRILMQRLLPTCISGLTCMTIIHCRIIISFIRVIKMWSFRSWARRH